MMFAGHHLSPIGIDFGRQAIKAVQWSGPRGSPRIVASAAIARTSEAVIPSVEESRRLGEILWRRGFQGRRAVAGVPEGAVLTSVVEIPPPASGVPIAQIAAGELARLHGVDPASLESDYWVLPPAGPKGQRHEAVAVGARREEVLALLDSLQSSAGGGFEVMAVDASACARFRAASLVARPDQTWALLDLGWSAARLSVIHQGLMIYDRALPDSGIAHLELRLEQECALKQDEIRHVLGQVRSAPTRRISGTWLGAVGTYAATVAAEAKDSLRYLSLHRGIAIPRSLVLTGGGAESAPVVAQLTDAMEGASAPLVLRAFGLGRPGDPNSPTGSSLSTALGLALWAA